MCKEKTCAEYRSQYNLFVKILNDRPVDTVDYDIARLFKALLIRAIGTGELGSNDLMQALGLSHRPTFRGNYLNPALENEWVERTQPDSPRSPTERYRLTGKGGRWLQHNVEE